MSKILRFEFLNWLKEDYLKHLDRKSDFFLKNLNLINEACKEQKVTLYVITQQAKSSIVDGDKMKNLYYDMEVELVKKKIEKEPISSNELYFLTHVFLMKELRNWAKENNVFIIEGINALDNNRDYLSSWVHLTPEGNLILAKEITTRILSTYSCEE